MLKIISIVGISAITAVLTTNHVTYRTTGKKEKATQYKTALLTFGAGVLLGMVFHLG